MAAGKNLSGSWSGEYQQQDRAHPIAAEFRQSGDELAGSMRDLVSDTELSVTEAAADAGGPGLDEQIVERLRAMFPDDPDAPIRYVAHLPGESTLEGWVRETGVYFVKRYQGVHFSGFRVGERLVGTEIEGHAVHYSGRVAPGGDEIEGRWWIDPPPGLGGRRTEGSFRLRRAEAAEAGAGQYAGEAAQ